MGKKKPRPYQKIIKLGKKLRKSMKNPRHNQKIETLLKIITTPRQKHMKKIHRKCIEITGNH